MVPKECSSQSRCPRPETWGTLIIRGQTDEGKSTKETEMEQPVNQEGQQNLEFWKAVFKEDRQIKAEVFNDDKGRASLVVQTIKNLSAMQETWVDPWVRKIPWRREQLPTPVFLPEKSHGQRSLADHNPLGRKELYMTEQLTRARNNGKEGQR